jgi:signal transduction histidine kinase
LRTLQRGENVIGQQEIIKRSDGSNIPVLVSAVAFSEEQSVRLPQKKTGPLTLGTEPLALVIHQDVTLLKEADYLKDEFIGIAAHELRTPLAVLTGYADMLLVQTARGHGPALAAWQQEALEEIKLATTRLVTLTEDLLDVTRLQAGRLILQRSWTNVIPLIQRVAKELQQTTARHRIEVHTPPSHLVVSLEIDAKRIEQVMTNLISNAIKYSPQGGLISVTLREDPPTQSAQIEVQDTGIGIPQSQQARLFGRFIRADNAIAWGISGTGLGLYLCRELVEQHGGHLWFASEEGRGSTFFLTLPGKLEVLVPLSVPYDA